MTRGGFSAIFQKYGTADCDSFPVRRWNLLALQRQLGLPYEGNWVDGSYRLTSAGDVSVAKRR